MAVFPMAGATTTERIHGAYSIAMLLEIAMMAALVAQSEYIVMLR